MIEEGDELDSQVTDQIYEELTSLIDQVVALQTKPAVCTLTVER